MTTADTAGFQMRPADGPEQHQDLWGPSELVAMRVALVLLTTAAWGQNREQSTNGWFRVSFGADAQGVAPTIKGHVYNDSPCRVTDVRLQVEGVDAESHPVGQRFAWAFGDIAPGGETSFAVETMRGAVTYRITVDSFDVVSVGQTP